MQLSQTVTSQQGVYLSDLAHRCPGPQPLRSFYHLRHIFKVRPVIAQDSKIKVSVVARILINSPQMPQLMEETSQFLPDVQSQVSVHEPTSASGSSIYCGTLEFGVQSVFSKCLMVVKEH